jgi:ferredoxin
MEVLLRENYQWTKAKFDISTGSITKEDGVRIVPTNIVSIRDDERSEYVVCKNCGEFIRNTTEEIEKHYNKCANSDACMTCKHLRVRENKELSREYELNDDGTYKQTIQNECNLTCCITSYGSGPDINSEDARSICRYSRCRSMGTNAIEDIFTKYSEVFDRIATVDALDDKVWTFDHRKEDGTFLYRAKKRFRLYAAVNSMGIIDHFVYAYDRNVTNIAYSAKHEKAFVMNHGFYENINRHIGENRVKEIVATISKIYKE